MKYTMQRVQCSANEKSDTWPYVKQCGEDATRLMVYVKPLDKIHDLCERHYHDYLGQVPMEYARDLVKKHGN